jgi:hypothetical protein
MARLVMMMSHTVRDYRKWKPVFDRDRERQRAAGLTRPVIYRATTAPGDIVIKWDAADKKSAKAFVRSAALQGAMKTAGVLGEPQVFFQEFA